MTSPPLEKDPASECVSGRGLLAGYGLTTAFCIAIGLLLWLIGLSSLIDSMIVSLAIGLSINTSFVLFESRVERLLPAYLAPIPLQVGGLIVGLVIGGWALTQDPWFFFRKSQGTVVLGVFFGAVGYLIMSSRARLAESAAQLAIAEQRQAEQLRQLADNQLKLLQAQIEPHFLFNTLSNVSSLIHTDPDAAEAMIANLTVLLRQSLKRTREQQTTLGEELQFLEAYLNIQKIRMGQRLRFAFAVPDGLREIKLAPLLLQPLVENAVVHGLEPRAEGGEIRICAQQRGPDLQLQVIDTGIGIAAASNGPGLATTGTHNGTALNNIRQRLQALYGDGARLRLLEPSAGGVCAELTIPVTSS